MPGVETVVGVCRRVSVGLELAQFTVAGPEHGGDGGGVRGRGVPRPVQGPLSRRALSAGHSLKTLRNL